MKSPKFPPPKKLIWLPESFLGCVEAEERKGAEEQAQHAVLYLLRLFAVEVFKAASRARDLLKTQATRFAQQAADNET